MRRARAFAGGLLSAARVEIIFGAGARTYAGRHVHRSRGDAEPGGSPADPPVTGATGHPSGRAAAAARVRWSS